jgi:osmotically-inducible protein OsmY
MSDEETYGGEERGWWDRTSDEVASWFGDEDAERRREMDERSSYRGRGPRGYTRSDDRIKEDINDELTESWNLDASDIEVEVNDGNVVLTGTVDSRYGKRLAEDLAEDVSGVKNVENRIRVNTGQSYDQNYGQRGSSTTTGTSGTIESSQTRSAGGGGTT